MSKRKLQNVPNSQKERPSGIVKNCNSQPFSRENVLWTNKYVLSFWPLKLVFCYSRLNTKHKLLKNPDSNATFIQPKPPAPQSISSKLSNNMGSWLFGGSKLITKIHFTKKGKFCDFFGIKAFGQRKSNYMLKLLLEILQAACLSLD